MRNEKLKTHIPLKTDEALRFLLKVKPTEAMPRPGANPTGKVKRSKAAPKKAK